MAHMIDLSNNQANIAYVGETPWHKLGAELQPGQPIDVWAKAAGLAHEVHRSPVEFHDTAGEYRLYADRSVLYRSDTLKPLSVVSTSHYNIVQPAEVLAFFDKLVRHNGFALETAGSLDGGKRVWALARVSDGAPVIGHDLVRPYVLLATSYDGTMATVAKFTTVRVVCHNTLTMSAGYGAIKGEDDAPGAAVRVAHSKRFDADAARLDLGIAFTAFDRFLIESRRLAKREVNETFAVEFLRTLLPTPVKTVSVAGAKVVQPQPIEESKGFQQIMGLFRGEALGADLPEARGTAWNLLNAITQHVDWQRGRSDNGRMASAWFGAGEALKNKARELLLEVVS